MREVRSDLAVLRGGIIIRTEPGDEALWLHLVQPKPWQQRVRSTIIPALAISFNTAAGIRGTVALKL
jgi:hypothetical protein